METTSKPVIAGILNIAAGISALIGACVLALIGLVGAGAIGIFAEGAEAAAIAPAIIFLPIALFTFTCGAVSVAGGVVAMQRRRWRLAVAGSIAALFALLPAGIASVILTVQSEQEFGAR